jgi:hypothetical protein
MYDVVVDAYCRLVRWEIWGMKIMSAIVPNLKHRYGGTRKQGAIVRNTQPLLPCALCHSDASDLTAAAEYGHV